MTRTNTLPAPPADLATVPTRPRRHYDILMNLIVVLLAPMFLAASDGDVDMARMAAFETVNAYRARHHADLIAIAQIIAFGLAALYSLSLSMADDVSLPVILTLHRNANALNRSAEQNRRAIKQHPHDNPTPNLTPLEPHAAVSADDAAPPDDTPTREDALPPDAAPPPEDAPPPEPVAFLTAAAAESLTAESDARLQIPQPPAARRHASPPAIPEPALPATSADPAAAEKRNQAMWAIVMVKEASELTANLPNLPPGERRAAEIRAAALGAAANEILTGVPSRPLTPERICNSRDQATR